MRDISVSLTLLLCAVLSFTSSLHSAENVPPDDSPIPAIEPNVKRIDGKLFYHFEDKQWPLLPSVNAFTTEMLRGNPQGTEEGIAFDFSGLPDIEGGYLYAGLIPLEEATFPQPVFIDKKMMIQDGKTVVPIKFFANQPGESWRDHDITRWEFKGHGVIGYRVIDNSGHMLYDGKIGFLGKRGGPFTVNSASILEGPFVHFSNQGTLDTAVQFSFKTRKPTLATIEIRRAGRIFKTLRIDTPVATHEVTCPGLLADTKYQYTIRVEEPTSGHAYEEGYTFRTAPKPGSQAPFTFAYTSDGRTGTSGVGGGYRFMTKAINAEILKKTLAIAMKEDARFLQFTGDMISGYDSADGEHMAEYASWKRVIEPFAHHMPVLVGMGNHDAAINDIFNDGSSKYGIEIGKFPYATRSAEAIFAREFVLPRNGPVSEDGQPYDPNPNTMDFPPYRENVYHYTYGNVAMVVLNTEYWYAPGLDAVKRPWYAGGLHGYIWDGQLAWFEKTMQTLQRDKTIDHIFVTFHTPAFPNSGHIKNSMWYHGDNRQRSVLLDKDGKNRIETGIIEQRDRFLLVCMANPKTRMLLAGDEHNFVMTNIDKDTEIYPEGWTGEDIRKSASFRPIIQMTNGAAGAPYYAQGKAPWSSSSYYFSTQNALALFRVEGKRIQCEVINPDTLEYIIKPGDLVLGEDAP